MISTILVIVCLFMAFIIDISNANMSARDQAIITITDRYIELANDAPSNMRCIKISRACEHHLQAIKKLTR